MSSRQRQITNNSLIDPLQSDQASHAAFAAYRVSPAPRNPVPTIHKKKNRLLNMDTFLHHAMPSKSSISSISVPPLTRDSTMTTQLAAIPVAQGGICTHESVPETRSRDSFYRPPGTRPPSISSRTSRISSVLRQSSLKHRMLNRLASGFLPPESKVQSEAPPVSLTESPILQKGTHQPIAKAELKVRQADMSANSSAFFAIDIGCSITANGSMPLNVAILVDNS